jgi:hypothetical protein
MYFSTKALRILRPSWNFFLGTRNCAGPTERRDQVSLWSQTSLWVLPSGIIPARAITACTCCTSVNAFANSACGFSKEFTLSPRRKSVAASSVKRKKRSSMRTVEPGCGPWSNGNRASKWDSKVCRSDTLSLMNCGLICKDRGQKDFINRLKEKEGNSKLWQVLESAEERRFVGSSLSGRGGETYCEPR